MAKRKRVSWANRGIASPVSQYSNIRCFMLAKIIIIISVIYLNTGAAISLEGAFGF